MNVFPQRNYKPYAVNTRRDNSVMLAHVGFSGAATLALLVPVLFFCFVVGHVWPFYLVAGSEALGAAIGVMNFKASVGRKSEFGMIDIPRTPNAKQPPKLKKAA